MNKKLKHRSLLREEINKLSQIDRTELIDNIYYERSGNLVLEKEHYEVPSWSYETKQRMIKELQNIYDNGATFFGTFSENDLVGMSVLNHNPLASGNIRLNLEGLWVSHKFRKKGIGKALFRLTVQEAQNRNAKVLYVSATPSKNTVHFYMNLACKRAVPIDPFLYNKEPEDIHLELILL